MAISAFTDKLVQPGPDEISESLGSKKALWDQLTLFLKDHTLFEGLLIYGGKSYGWNIWYRRNGKTLVTLYPQKDGFTIQLVLGSAQVEKAMDLKLEPKIRNKLVETPQLHDGKWLFMQVETGQDVDDIIQLIQVKQKPRP